VRGSHSRTRTRRRKPCSRLNRPAKRCEKRKPSARSPRPFERQFWPNSGMLASIVGGLPPPWITLFPTRPIPFISNQTWFLPAFSATALPTIMYSDLWGRSAVISSPEGWSEQMCWNRAASGYYRERGRRTGLPRRSHGRGWRLSKSWFQAATNSLRAMQGRRYLSYTRTLGCPGAKSQPWANSRGLATQRCGASLSLGSCPGRGGIGYYWGSSGLGAGMSARTAAGRSSRLAPSAGRRHAIGTPR